MFRQADYIKRVEQLQDRLRETGYDTFVVTTTDGIFYLTGADYEPLERPMLLVIRAEGSVELIAPLLERGHIGSKVPWADMRIYSEYPAAPENGWKAALEIACDKRRRIATEPYTRVEISTGLNNPMEPQPFLEELRLIKSPPELELIRRAAYYSDRQVRLMREVIQVGTTVSEVWGATSLIGGEMMKELGDDYSIMTTSHLTVPWAAPANAEPHRIPLPTDVFEAEGPHNLTALARFAGYSAESERLFMLRPLAPKVADAARAVSDARKLAWSLLRPGTPASEIDAAVQDLFVKRGYSDAVRHRTGHGFGLGGHEGPWLAVGSQEVLRANMVVSVEPGLYFPGVGGIRDSDTILITDDGFEVLTKEPYAEMVVL